MGAGFGNSGPLVIPNGGGGGSPAASDISDATATGIAVVTAVDAEAARTAIGAVGTARTVAGLSLASNRSASDVLEALRDSRVCAASFGVGTARLVTPSAASNPPQWTDGWTIVFLMARTAAVGSTVMFASNGDNGHLRLGDYGDDMNAVQIYTGGAQVRLPISLTTQDQRYAFAIAISGSNAKTCVDGGAVSTTALGVTPWNLASSHFSIGAFLNAFDCACEMYEVASYSTVLSDADLAVVTAGAAASGKLATGVTGTLRWRFRARDTLEDVMFRHHYPRSGSPDLYLASSGTPIITR